MFYEKTRQMWRPLSRTNETNVFETNLSTEFVKIFPEKHDKCEDRYWEQLDKCLLRPICLFKKISEKQDKCDDRGWDKSDKCNTLFKITRQIWDRCSVCRGKNQTNVLRPICLLSMTNWDSLWNTPYGRNFETERFHHTVARLYSSVGPARSQLHIGPSVTKSLSVSLSKHM